MDVITETQMCSCTQTDGAVVQYDLTLELFFFPLMLIKKNTCWLKTTGKEMPGIFKL